MQEQKLQTSHGTIHVVSAGNGDPAILLVHGNSCCWKMFTPFFADEHLTSSHRVVSFDLPGHGSSSDAADPGRTYNMAAYGEVALEVLRLLGIKSVIVFGASLGGHIGIEMVAQLAGSDDIEIRGLMITGTPPASGKEQAAEGFYSNLPSETLTDDTIEFVIRHGIRGAREPWQWEMIRRADGRARKLMAEAFLQGRGADQRKVVAEMSVPLAVVNGGDEAMVRLDTLDKLEYGNLWQGHCIRLPGLSHSPFWEDPAAFLPVFEHFVADCSSTTS